MLQNIEEENPRFFGFLRHLHISVPFAFSHFRMFWNCFAQCDQLGWGWGWRNLHSGIDVREVDEAVRLPPPVDAVDLVDVLREEVPDVGAGRPVPTRPPPPTQPLPT